MGYHTICNILDCQNEFENLKNMIFARITDDKKIPNVKYIIAAPLLGSYHICEGAFIKNTYIKSVIIENNVDTIKSEAFRECENLERVVFPLSLKYIDVLAFFVCRSLKELNIPKNVLKINNATFSNCANLETVNIYSREADIITCCFSECFNLKNLTLYTPFNNIAVFAFAECSSLKKIRLLKNQTITDYQLENVFYLVNYNGKWVQDLE